MDDCFSQFKDPKFKELMLNGRHYHLWTILTLQFPVSINPSIRSNMDYVVLFADENEQNQRRLYEKYGGVFPTFELFQQAFIEMTSCEYGCMVINNGTFSKNVRDIVFWYKAE